MDDNQIIELYFARNEQAIKETDAKYGKLCFSVANRILENNEDSEECVNDTYLNAWNMSRSRVGKTPKLLGKVCLRGKAALIGDLAQALLVSPVCMCRQPAQ